MSKFMNQPPKNFITQYLFCNHKWKSISDLNYYTSNEKFVNSLPIERYLRWECENCGRIKKLRIV